MFVRTAYQSWVSTYRCFSLVVGLEHLNNFAWSLLGNVVSNREKSFITLTSGERHDAARQTPTSQERLEWRLWRNPSRQICERQLRGRRLLLRRTRLQNHFLSCRFCDRDGENGSEACSRNWDIKNEICYKLSMKTSCHESKGVFTLVTCWVL